MSTSVKDDDRTQAKVTFDAATSPLPAGEYVVKLRSTSVGAEVAVTHFVVMKPFGTGGLSPWLSRFVHA